MKKFVLAFACLASCAGHKRQHANSAPDPMPADAPGYVIRATAMFPVATGPGASATDQNTQVTVTLAPSTVMSLDLTGWNPPASPAPFKTDDLGALTIKTLEDNHLNLCGPKSDQPCTRALLRLYTTGEPGPGLWNTQDNYGAPLSTGALPVGLSAQSAAVVGQVQVSSTQHVLTLADFPDHKYDLKSDFTGAGTGSYQTMIVVEYVLAP